MSRDTKVMLALAWFGGFFYWVAVGEFNRIGSDLTFFRDPWTGYLVALGIAALIGILMKEHRWLGGALIVVPGAFIGPETTSLDGALGSGLGVLFLPVILIVICGPPALVAETVGRVFWILRFFLSKESE